MEKKMYTKPVAELIDYERKEDILTASNEGDLYTSDNYDHNG